MADTPANTSTTRTITVDGPVVDDTLENPGDHDWFAVTLVAGQTYTFITASITGTNDYSTDTTLALRDPSGHLIAFNDDYDNPPGQMSKITFTATTSGTYYLDVGGYNDNAAGDYRLSAFTAAPTALPVYDNDQIALQLTDGYWGGDPHHWDVAPGGTLDVYLGALESSGRFLARTALDLWSDATGIVFAEVGSAAAADIDFTDDQEGAFTNMAWSNGLMTQATVNISLSWLATYGTSLGSYSLQTYVHEIGHALGLGHAGDYNGSATYPDDALYANDAWPATIMSYFDPRNDNDWFSDKGFTYQFTLSPMVADIVATTDLYGARSGLTRTGDTTYGFNNSSGRDIYDPALASGAAVTVVDDGGIDTLDYSQTANAQQIWLEPEVFSNVLGRTGNLVIARGTVIENAIGGSGSDILIGNAADNALTGNAGMDILYGEDGDDTLDGGAGDDEIDGGAGADTIVASAGADLLSGGADADTFVFGAALGVLGAVAITDFEAGDVLDFTTDPGDPVQLTTFIGSTAFTGTAGEYRYELSGGQTLVQYDGDGDGNSDGQVTITNGEFSLSQLTADGVPVDVLGMATNTITGTNSTDFIDGTAGDDDISALNANDVIHASPGTDTVDGGQGDDRLIFRMDEPAYFPAFSGAQTYTLTGSRLSDDNGRVDTSFTSVEAIEFYSATDDLVTFDASAFVPTTPEGFVFYPLTVTMSGDNSSVTGSAYNDFFSFTGLGHVVDGGAGVDVVTIDPLASATTIFVTTTGGVTTASRGDGSGLADLNVQATNAEIVRLAVQSDGSTTQTVDASGSALAMVFNDGAGDDTFTGSDQADFFFHSDFTAGNGNDVYWGGDGDDTYSFGPGISQFDGTTIMDFAAGDLIDLNTNILSAAQLTVFLGTAAFTGTAGEYRYYHSGGQTFVEYDGDGDGTGDGTLTIANGELDLVQYSTSAGAHNLVINPNITGTENADVINTTSLDETVVALGGNDRILASMGADSYDGGAGDDRVQFLENVVLPGIDADVTYTLTGSSFTSDLGGMTASLTSIERFFFRSDNPGLLTFDASGYVPSPASTYVVPLSITLLASNSRITGSPTDDDFTLAGSNHVVDGGAGVDLINIFVTQASGTITVGTDAGDLTIEQAGVDPDRTSVRASDVEYLRFWGTFDPSQGMTLDASASSVPIYYGDYTGSDTIIGSAFNDFFTAELDGIDGTDTYTGGAGADYYSFRFAIPRLDDTIITDFATEDVLDLNSVGPVPITSFLGTAAFTGTAGEYRYFTSGGQTLVQYDGDGDGTADGTLTLANGEFTLEQFTNGAGDHNLRIAAAPANVITGTPLADTLTGTEDADEIDGLAGDDTIDGRGGDDIMRGGAGDDSYFVDSSADQVVELAGEGLDFVLATANFVLGDNVENLRLQNYVTQAEGNELDNVISASPVRNAIEIYGHGGNDNIRGGKYDDFLYGGDGDDYIFGDDGNDYIDSGAGNDRILGGAGDDEIDGGPGDDFINASGGNDTIRGGDGEDILLGRSGVDIIDGGADGDLIRGAQNDDQLSGGGGRDQLFGDDGDDWLQGGADQDFFTGGNDADTFVFDEPDMAGTSGGSADRILDFDRSEGDIIDLSAIDAIAGGTDDPFTFIGDAAFSGTAGELRYVQQNNYTMLHMDIDGDGRSDFAIRLEGLYDPVDGDFIL